MNAYDWHTTSFENIVRTFSNYMAKLWKVHPYREGNTRTIVTFCCMFIEAQGIYIESDLFKDNASSIMLLKNIVLTTRSIDVHMEVWSKTEWQNFLYVR